MKIKRYHTDEDLPLPFPALFVKAGFRYSDGIVYFKRTDNALYVVHMYFFSRLRVLLGKHRVERGVTVLLIEQNANMALQIAHSAYVLETGNITMSGTGAELLADSRIREAYLGKSKTK